MAFDTNHRWPAAPICLTCSMCIQPTSLHMCRVKLMARLASRPPTLNGSRCPPRKIHVIYVFPSFSSLYLHIPITELLARQLFSFTIISQFCNVTWQQSEPLSSSMSPAPSYNLQNDRNNTFMILLDQFAVLAREIMERYRNRQISLRTVLGPAGDADTSRKQ